MTGWVFVRLVVGVYAALHSNLAHSMRMDHLHRTMRAAPSRLASQATKSEVLDEPEVASVQVMCHLNGRCIPATIDTAAQVSVMSADCVRRLKLTQFVDARYGGKAIGVGTQDITGEIRNLPIRMGSAVVFPRIAVLKSQMRSSNSDHSTARMPEFLIGMDVLRKHNAEISLGTQTLKLHTKHGRGHVIPLLDRPASSSSFLLQTRGSTTEVATEEQNVHRIHTPTQSNPQLEETQPLHQEASQQIEPMERYHIEQDQELSWDGMEGDEEQISLEGF